MIFLPSAKFLYRPQTTVAPWTPLSLTTALYGWYKGDAGISVTTDGASVATWADQSTNNNNLAQANTANRGVFRTATNGVNGIPVLEFPSSLATPRFIEDTAFLGSDSDGWSFYIVSRNLPVRLQYGGAFIIGRSTDGAFSQMCDGTYSGQTNIRPSNSPGGEWAFHPAIASFAVTKMSCGASLDSAKYKTTYTSAVNQTGTGNLLLGAGFKVGSNYYGSVGSQIAEVIVCKRELDATEEANLDAYLFARYNFSLSQTPPLPVTGAALWLDASRSDTLFVENTLATPVTTDNGPVGGWKDLSGNNRHALQSGTNRPTWRTPINGQNGLGAMSFNGSTQYFDVANFPSLASGYTFYCVLKKSTAGATVFTTSGSGTLNTVGSIYQDSTVLHLTQWGTSISQAVTTGSVVGYIGNYDGSHPTGNYFLQISQNAANTTGTMTQNAGAPAAGDARVGRATGTQTLYFNSQIYELVVLPRQSTTTEDTAWKNYTTAKWGITWS